MKRVYPIGFAVCIYIAAILSPRISIAQCACAGGTIVTQTVQVDPSTAPSTLITFNKFTNTPLQQLTCMTIQDTLTIVSSTAVRNTASGPIPNASFTITASGTLTGPPSISSLQKGSMDYGPYNFGAAGSPTDTYLLGPDTLVNKKVTLITPSNVTPYIGTGTVSDTLIFGGGQTSYAGTSFTYNVDTKYWATFVITYYTCPPVALSTDITNFTAVQNGSTILLQWLTNNEQNNNNYEIQVSTDGKQFSSAGQEESEPAAAGATTKHQYQYNTDQANVGKLYFRIKVTDATGKVSYSTILVINPGGSGDGSVSFQTYPNPATNSLVFQFTSNQTGHYLLELINTAGQVVQQKSVTLTGANQLRLDLNPQPARGLYFLRTKDLTHNQNYVSKVLIN
ncbi:MAG TPA: T9SS type A sorting domain-containing protein [Puia sp.]|nr:T9SS type A sorting domain-containing protein [Puia sp.]